MVRVVQAEESGQRLLRVEGVPGVRPADLQEELTDQRPGLPVPDPLPPGESNIFMV